MTWARVHFTCASRTHDPPGSPRQQVPSRNGGGRLRPGVAQRPRRNPQVKRREKPPSLVSQSLEGPRRDSVGEGPSVMEGGVSQAGGCRPCVLAQRPPAKSAAQRRENPPSLVSQFPGGQFGP